MKTNTRFFLFVRIVWLTTALASCRWDTISPGPGQVVTTNRSVTGFNGIDVRDGIQTTLVKGTAETATIEAGEGYQPYILTDVVNGVLRIRVDKRLRNRRAASIKAVVTFKSLTSLTTSGGVRLTSSDSFESANLEIDVSGGGTINIPVQTDVLTIGISGGSVVDLMGTAKKITADVSGGGTLKSANLAVSTCTINASGGSVAEINASQELNVTASGGSRVHYRGTPKITKSLSGGSTVSPF